MKTMRKCIGSARFGIEAHQAPVADFPRQPSQKDGLGRMCKTHWKEYVAGLARERAARPAVDAAVKGEGPMPPAGSIAAARKGGGTRRAKKPETTAQEAAEERRKDREAQQAVLAKLRARAPKPEPEPIRTRVPRGRRPAVNEAEMLARGVDAAIKKGKADLSASLAGYKAKVAAGSQEDAVEAATHHHPDTGDLPWPGGPESDCHSPLTPQAGSQGDAG